MKPISKNELLRRKMVIEATEEYFGSEEEQEVKDRIAKAIITGQTKYLDLEEKAISFRIRANIEA